MAITLEELLVKLGVEDSDFQRGLAGATKILDQTAAQFTRAGLALSAGLTAPLVGLGAASLSAAGDMDTLKRGLTAVEGSSAAANAALQRMVNVAKLPGLGLREVVSSFVQMRAAGVSAQQSERAIRDFGNALAIVGKGRADLGPVITQFVQMSNKAKVVMSDLKPIMERVPQVATIIKQAFGTIDTEALQKMGIGPAQMIETILAGLERLPAATIGVKGAFENFGDIVFIQLSRIGESLIPIATKFLEVATVAVPALASAFTSLPGPVQSVVIGIAALAAAIGPLLLAMGGASYGLSSLVGLVAPLGAQMGASAAGVNSFNAGMQVLQGAATAAGTALRGLGIAAGIAAAAWVGWGIVRDVAVNLRELLPSVSSLVASFGMLAAPLRVVWSLFGSLLSVINPLLIAQASLNNLQVSFGELVRRTMGPLGSLLDVTSRLVTAKEYLTGRYKSMDEAMLSTLKTFQQSTLATVQVSEASLQHQLAMSAQSRAATDAEAAIARMTGALGSQAPVVEVVKLHHEGLAETLRKIESSNALRKLEEDWFAVLNAVKRGQPLIADALGVPTVGGGIDVSKISGPSSGIDDTIAKMTKLGQETFPQLNTQVTTGRTRMTEFDREIRKAFDGMARGIAESIVNWQGFFGTLQNIGKTFAKGMLEIMIQGWLQPLQDAVAKHLGSALSAIPGIGGFFGGGASAAGGVAKGAGGAASAAGGLAAAANPLNMVTGAIGAVPSVIGNFQMAGMNKSLDLIEHETRYSQIHLGYILEKLNQYIPGIADIHGYLYEHLHPALEAIVFNLETINERMLGGLTPAGAVAGAGGSPVIVAALVADDRNMETFADRLMEILKNRGL